MIVNIIIIVMSHNKQGPGKVVPGFVHPLEAEIPKLLKTNFFARS